MKPFVLLSKTDSRFDKTWTDPINAKQFAAELVKHNYREGWRLPDMPR